MEQLIWNSGVHRSPKSGYEFWGLVMFGATKGHAIRARPEGRGILTYFRKIL